MEFYGSSVQEITVKVLKVSDNEVWININPFVGKQSIYRKIILDLRKKISFNIYKTFERLEPIPIITKAGELKTLYYLEKGRKPILVIPADTTEEEINRNIEPNEAEQLKKIKVKGFDIFTFYRVRGFDLLFDPHVF